MGIVQRRKPPASGPKAIGRALRDLRGQPDDDALLGGAEINLSRPLPVYRLGLDELHGADFLKRATPVGWRYLVERPGGDIAYADVKEAAGGESRFASLSPNRNAERLMAAAHLAEQVARSLADDCEARILDVPALYISAIWLTGPSPHFIPFIEAESLADPEARVALDHDFLNRLLRRAEVARQHIRDIGQGPAPSASRVPRAR